MTGKDAPYVPGWDCHGLPIEWKVEEEYKKKGKNKDTIPVNEFRKECREFAARWIEIQNKEFYRLGFGKPTGVSAEHKLGFGDLYDKIAPEIEKYEEIFAELNVKNQDFETNNLLNP
jgi:hypothetical protein